MFGSQGDDGRLKGEEDQPEEDQLSRLLEQVDSLVEGCEEDQTQAYNMLKAEEQLVNVSSTI